MQKELTNRSGFFLESHRKEGLAFLTQFHLQLPEALSSLTPLEQLHGVTSLSLHWDSTDSQVLGSEGWLAGILYEDNRMEMLLFSASSYSPTFMRTHRTHVLAADVFLYTRAEQFPWLGILAFPNICITGKKLQLPHCRNMGAQFSSPGSVQIIWTGIFPSIMFWNVTLLPGEAWLLPSLSSPSACSICTSCPHFLACRCLKV